MITLGATPQCCKSWMDVYKAWQVSNDYRQRSPGVQSRPRDSRTFPDKTLAATERLRMFVQRHGISMPASICCCFQFLAFFPRTPYACAILKTPDANTDPLTRRPYCPSTSHSSCKGRTEYKGDILNPQTRMHDFMFCFRND